MCSLGNLCLISRSMDILCEELFSFVVFRGSGIGILDSFHETRCLELLYGIEPYEIDQIDTDYYQENENVVKSRIHNIFVSIFIFLIQANMNIDL